MDREGPHAVEAIDAIRTPGIVGGEDDLGVTAGVEASPATAPSTEAADAAPEVAPGWWLLAGGGELLGSGTVLHGRVASGVDGRNKSRSKYGTKRPKK